VNVCADVFGAALTLRDSGGGQVVTLNAEMTMAARSEPALAAVIESAELVIPDGAGVVWAMGRQGFRVRRSPGIELAWRLLQHGAERGWRVSHVDNVRAQVRLLEEVFGVEAPALIFGWSMGAQQGYHWAVLEPWRCHRLLALCGTARTTPHNRLFLLSLRHALTADPAWIGDRFAGPG
jgi:UDP-N-acetyl-D-mannosaminuronic acid transferase (WecB/TagA/CpsF family)